MSNLAYEAGVGLSDHVALSYTLNVIPLIIKKCKICMMREASAKFRKKQRAWKQYQKTKNNMDYVRATNENNEFTTLVRNLSRNFEQNMSKNLLKNPKDFRRYCKSKFKSRSRLVDLQSNDGSLNSEDKKS